MHTLRLKDLVITVHLISAEWYCCHKILVTLLPAKRAWHGSCGRRCGYGWCRRGLSHRVGVLV
jgi:hypothetical protein